MADGDLTFTRRLSMATTAFWRSLTDGGFATRLVPLLEPAAPAPGAEAPGTTLVGAAPRAALQILGLMQQRGRLIDFLEEDISALPDQDVGAAARLVHQRCRRVLREYLTIVPVRDEAEGSQVRVEAGFDPGAIRLSGNLVGQAPFTGRLVHRGWRATEVRLPQAAVGHDFSVLASAEVEL
jgi:Domain of unknown function (DUF2760)